MLVSELDLHQRHVPLLFLFGQSLLLRQTEQHRLGRVQRLPAGFCPSLLHCSGLRGPRVLLLDAPTGARCCRLVTRGGCWDGLPSASAFTLLLPLSVSVAELLVSIDHNAPAVLIMERSHTPQRDLSLAQIFYVNCHWTIVGSQLLDGGVVAPSTAL